MKKSIQLVPKWRSNAEQTAAEFHECAAGYSGRLGAGNDGVQA